MVYWFINYIKIVWPWKNSHFAAFNHVYISNLIKMEMEPYSTEVAKCCLKQCTRAILLRKNNKNIGKLKIDFNDLVDGSFVVFCRVFSPAWQKGPKNSSPSACLSVMYFGTKGYRPIFLRKISFVQKRVKKLAFGLLDLNAKLLLWLG